MRLICVIAMTVGAATVAAQSIDYSEREEGWFWYQDPEILEEEEIDPPEEPIVMLPQIEEEMPEMAEAESESEDEGHAPMSVPWLRENLPKALDRAIDDPGPDDINIRMYAYMQRATLDKAERFAYGMQRVVLSDPVLDENNRYPISSFASRAYDREREEDKKKRLEWLADKAGFFYFHDETCQYCQQQLPVLESIKKRYGFEMIAVSIGDAVLSESDTSLPTRIDTGQANRFQVQTVPAVVMVFPPDNVAILSQGMITRRGFENRAIAIAEDQGLLTSEVDEMLGVERREYSGEMAPEAEQISIDQPHEFINHIRRELGYEPIEE